MKKIVIFLVLIFVGGQFAVAQNLDDLFTDLAKAENVQHQVVDQEALNASLGQAMAQDSTGQLKSKMPAFMSKISKVEVAALENGDDTIKERFVSFLNTFKDGDEYITLMRVKEDTDNVRMIARKDGEFVSDVYILVSDGDAIVAVKMSGKLDQSDLEQIVKEQEKNKKN